MLSSHLHRALHYSDGHYSILYGNKFSEHESCVCCKNRISFAWEAHDFDLFIYLFILHLFICFQPVSSLAVVFVMPDRFSLKRQNLQPETGQFKIHPLNTLIGLFLTLWNTGPTNLVNIEQDRKTTWIQWVGKWANENTRTFGESTQTFQHANGSSSSAAVSKLPLEPEVTCQDGIGILGHHRLQELNHTEICFHLFHGP